MPKIRYFSSKKRSFALRIQAIQSGGPQDVEWDTGKPGATATIPSNLAMKAEIYLALGIDSKSAVSEETWDKFIREVVGVEFPLGFSAFAGAGGYLATIEPRRKVEVLLPAGEESRIEPIAAEWLRRANQSEVLVVFSVFDGGAL